jgi:hypothetical protein
VSEERESGWRGPVLRVGAAMHAMLYAVAVTVIVSQFNPTLRSGALFIVFGGFSVAFYLLWIWVFVVRPAELAKKLTISGSELRRKRQDFYDSLPK